MAKPQYSGPWKKIRLAVLERDGYVCQVRLKGCTIKATQVDHIIPASQGGAWFDDRNLRAACRHCNNQRVDRKGSDRWRSAATHIVLVMGPPGAGKSTYVDEKKSGGDLVVDYDRIAEGLGSQETHGHSDVIHKATMTARNAILNSIRRGETEARRAWIISANPDADSIFPFHERVLLDPGIDEVKRRITGAGRPLKWTQLVDDWYRKRYGSASTSDPDENTSARKSRAWWGGGVATG